MISADLDLILENLSNFSDDIVQATILNELSAAVANVLSPIDEINMNLRLFDNFIRLCHINSVSIPLHRDEIYRFVKSTKQKIVAFSETNIKKILLVISTYLKVTNFSIKFLSGVEMGVLVY